jgi:hypothetical protein
MGLGGTGCVNVVAPGLKALKVEKKIKEERASNAQRAISARALCRRCREEDRTRRDGACRREGLVALDAARWRWMCQRLGSGLEGAGSGE